MLATLMVVLVLLLLLGKQWQDLVLDWDTGEMSREKYDRVRYWQVVLGQGVWFPGRCCLLVVSKHEDRS